MMMVMMMNNNHVAPATGAHYWSNKNSVTAAGWWRWRLLLACGAVDRQTPRRAGLRRGLRPPATPAPPPIHGVAATLFESESSNYCAPEFTCFAAVIAHTHALTAVRGTVGSRICWTVRCLLFTIIASLPDIIWWLTEYYCPPMQVRPLCLLRAAGWPQITSSSSSSIFRPIFRQSLNNKI